MCGRSIVRDAARHACILADPYILAVRDLKILDDIVQDTLSDLPVLAGTAVTDRTFYISRKMIVGIDAESLDYIGECTYIDFTHESQLLSYCL